MGILARFYHKIKSINFRTTARDPAQWLIDWVHGGNQSASGIMVNEDNALSYSPFWAGVRIIAGDIGSLPLITYRRNGDDKERAYNHKVYSLLNERPNEYVDAITFREVLQNHVLTYGNGYAEIQRDGGGRPYALWPLLPDKTFRKIAENDIPYYEIHTPAGKENKYLADYNVLHIKGLGFDGLTGYNVVAYHKESLGLGMATKKYGAGFFGNGANPGGVLEHPGTLGPEAAKRLRESWNDLHSGLDNAHRMAILEEGMKFSATGVTPEQAQALETQKFSVDDTARILNLPPHKLASLDRATFSNIEHQGLDYLTTTLHYWFRKWEQECNYKLFLPGERPRYFVRFLIESFLRGDIKTRYEAYSKGRQWGWLSINDVRRLEDMNSIGEKGDDYLEPMNMKPAGEDPPAPVPPPVTPKAEPEDDDEKVRNAHRKVVTELCGRICRKEASALRKALKKPDTFNTVATRFYMTHGDYVKETLEQPIEAYVISLHGDTSRLHEYIDEISGLLMADNTILPLPISDVSRQLTQECIDSRAIQYADKIINDWSNNGRKQ